MTGDLWCSQDGELGSPVRVLSPSLPQHHLQLGAAIRLHRRFPGHPQTEPCVSIPPKRLPPPFWAIPVGAVSRCRVAGPRTRQDRWCPCCPRQPGGVVWGFASEWETIDQGRNTGSCPPRVGGDPREQGATLVWGAWGSPLSLVTPGRGGFAWSRCDNSGTGMTMVALVLPHTVAWAGPLARVGGVIWDWVCGGRGG